MSTKKKSTKRQPQDFYRVSLKLNVLCLVFGLKQKTRYEMGVKTFDKLLSVADSPVVVLFYTDSLV